jgi:phosphoglycerate dehydrogenase-like enzyme
MYDVIVLAPFSDGAKKSFEDAAQGQCRFTYAGSMTAPIDGYDVVFGNPSQKKVIAAGDKLKWVQLLTSGTDRYDTDFPKNVVLTNSTGVFGESISQHVMACLLSLTRRLPTYHTLQKQHRWQISGFGTSLRGKTVLILGAGDIGCSTGALLRPFGTKNIGVKRRITSTPECFDQMHTMEDIDALLPVADVVVCCLPSTPSTRGLLDSRRIGLIKSGAIIINVGRGDLIDTAALTSALKSGAIAGAAMDVTSPEPLPEDSELWDMDNVIITPHVSGPSFSPEGYMCPEIAQLCSENIRAFITGSKLTNPVDLSQGYAVKYGD